MRPFYSDNSVDGLQDKVEAAYRDSTVEARPQFDLVVAVVAVEARNEALDGSGSSCLTLAWMSKRYFAAAIAAVVDGNVGDGALAWCCSFDVAAGMTFPSSSWTRPVRGP